MFPYPLFHIDAESTSSKAGVEDSSRETILKNVVPEGSSFMYTISIARPLGGLKAEGSKL